MGLRGLGRSGAASRCFADCEEGWDQEGEGAKRIKITKGFSRVNPKLEKI